MKQEETFHHHAAADFRWGGGGDHFRDFRPGKREIASE
jgi:hypothetical protein